MMLQVLQTVAVVLGVLFGLFQLRQLRRDREAQAGIELLNPLQTSDARRRTARGSSSASRGDRQLTLELV